MQRKWVIGTLALALVFVMPGIAFGQQIAGVTEATMLPFYDNMALLAGIDPDTTDLDDFGVPTRTMIGSFGRLSSANAIPAAVVTAFNANRALAAAGSNGTLDAIVPGYDEVSAYLASIICDTDGSTDAFAVIQGFAAALGAPNGALTDLSAYNCTAAAAMKSAIFTELGLAQQQVVVSGGSEVFIAFDSPYTAKTIDQDNPNFTETHTFSSSDTTVMVVSAAGVARGVKAGTANVVATGNTTTLTASKTVTVRAGDWFELCDWDDIFTSEGATLTLVAGCDFFDTGVFQDVDGLLPTTDLDPGPGTLFTKDDVPDHFQVTLLAYVLCRGADFIGPEAKVSPPAPETVEDQFLANTAYFDRMFLQLDDILDWFSTGLTTIDITGAVPFTGLGGSIVLTATSNNVLDTTFAFEALQPNKVSIVSSTATTVTVKAEGEGSGQISATGATSGLSHIAAIAVDDITTSNPSISGANDLNEGQTDTLTATTVGPGAGESFTWSSNAPAVATIIASSNNTALVTAVAGTFGGASVTFTATGAVSSVEVPAVTAATAKIKVFLGETCSEAKSGDTGETAKATISGVKDTLTNVIELWNGALQALNTSTFAPVFRTGGVGAGGANSELLALGAGGIATAGALNGSTVFGGGMQLHQALIAVYEGFGSVFADADAVENYLVAQAGISQEHAGMTAGTFNFAALAGTGATSLGFYLTNATPGVNVTGLNATLAAITSATTAFATPASAGNSAIRAMRSNIAILTTLTSALVKPVFNDLDLFIYGSDVEGGPFSKIAGIDPLHGDTVFSPGTNPQDLTNAEYAAGVDDLVNDDFDGVVELGGDEFDFVALVTGEDLLATGSPFLPAAGALALGLLAGGVAFAAARRLRRNK